MSNSARVTVWNEFVHERENDSVRRIYPDGIHATIAAGISKLSSLTTRTAVLQEPEYGLSDAVLNETDVLIWWGHKAHDQVEDVVVSRVHQAVLSGMGLVVLHSGHFSKIFRAVMGTNCSLRWREADERERLWNLAPAHPILAGIPDFIELEREEMYGERFDVPEPDEVLMISWFQGGDVFRSLCTWRRGHGRVVYFRPGHETYPTYHNEYVIRVIANACEWARARVRRDTNDAPNVPALEPVPSAGTRSHGFPRSRE